MLIIPDVHGRKFWKDAAANYDGKIIFLGDYVDCYPQEGIDPDDAVQNFKEILEFAEANKDRVILLIGNHDCTYLYSPKVCECRTDYKNYNEIRALFFEYIHLFKIAHCEAVSGTNVLFSHAGFHKEYVDGICGEGYDDPFEIAEKFNVELLRNNSLNFIASLSQVSYLRGGYGYNGSVVWADVREFKDLGPSYENTFQIFAHTGSLGPYIQDNFAMLDAQRAFLLTDDCKLTELEGSAVQNNDIWIKMEELGLI